MKSSMRVLAALLAIVVLIPELIDALHYVREPGRVTGWEAAWVAQSIVDGHGFSFPGIHRWLFDKVASGQYFATAWVDPLYTYCLAALIYLFGPAHAVAAVWFNAVLLLIALALIYLTAERWLSPIAGIIVIIVIGLSHVWVEALDDMNNTLLATVLVAASFYQALRVCERPSAGGAVALGALLGITALGCPGALLLAPATALIAITSSRARWPQRWWHAALVCIATALVILPWTIRNYETFGAVIPIRDGGGMLAFVGTVSLAAAVEPDLVPSEAPAATWRTGSLRAAVDLAQARDPRRALEAYPLSYANAVDPSGYAHLDEAQRDAWLGSQATRFMVAHPGFVASAVPLKLELFVRVIGGVGRVTIVLALLALVLAFRDAKVRLAGAWVAAFAAPFGLIICYFDRYRAPVEPVVMILALFGVWRVVELVRTKAVKPSERS